MKRNRQAICIQLPDAVEGKLPTSLQCIPAPDGDGKVKGRDGRWWFFDQPELVMRNSPDRIAIDINHSTDLAAPRGAESPAAGWIDGKALSLVDGALYGTPKWNARGKAAIEGEDYAFLSPVFDYDASNRIQRLLRVSLTNNPNFEGLALNAAVLDEDVDDNPPERLTMNALLLALGLPVTATEAEGLTALNALKATHQTALNAAQTPDLNKFVPRSEFDAVQNRALNAEKKIEESDKTKKDKEVEKELDEAQAAGKITPASREFYKATCAAEGGLEKFREFVKTTVPVVEPGSQGKDGKPPEKGTALNAAQKQVAESLGLTEAQYLKSVAA